MRQKIIMRLSKLIKSQIFFCLLIIVVVVKADLGIKTNHDVADDNEANIDMDEEEWMKYHKQVFAFQGFPIPPEATLELMIRLKDHYSKQKDLESKKRGERIYELIQASKITLDKCDRGSIQKMNLLIKQNTASSLNLIPYLKENKINQDRFCFVNKFAKNLSQIQQLDRDNIEFLMNCIANSESGSGILKSFPVPEENLVNGLLLYLELRSALLIQKSTLDDEANNGKEKFREKFDEFVGNLCFIVDHALGFSLQEFKKSPVEKIDETTKNWIIKAQVCEKIINETDSLVDKGYEAFVVHQQELKAKLTEEINRRGGD